MIKQIIIITVTPENFIDKLTEGASDAITWGNTVGIGIIASVMAISLIKFLYDKG